MANDNVDDTSKASAWNDKTDLHAPRTSELARVVDHAQLVLLIGDGAGRVYTIAEHPVVIGRGSDATVKINTTDVSRNHCVIRGHLGRFEIEDLRSRNGTRVNGVPIGKHELSYGDKIQVGAGAVLVFTHYDKIDEQVLQLQKLDSIGQLAGGVAHDFGNLLHAVVGNIDFLLHHCRTRYRGDSELLEALEETKQAAAQGTELTARLLSFTRRGKAETAPVDVDLLVQEVSKLLRRALPRNIKLGTSTDPGLVVLGDRSGLHQVLMNICINARDAMPQGGKISIRTRRMQIGAEDMLTQPFLPVGAYAVLRIEDNGVGMDEQTKRKIFEPFFTTKDPGKGTGLGLASAYGIVRGHGGRIIVDSELGRGTCFEIHLPAHDAPRKGATTRMLQEPHLLQDAISGQVAPQKILLVDNDPMIRATTSRLLKHLGFDPICAENEHDALDHLRRIPEQILLVLLDTVTSDPDSSSLLETILSLDPTARVVLITRGANEDQARALIARGARGFLRKPFDGEALSRAIRLTAR